MNKFGSHTMPPESIRPGHSTTNTLTLALTNDLYPTAAATVLKFCYGACRIDGECLGWMPRAAYDAYHARGKILALWNNNDLVGFVVFSANLGELRCLQVWVRRDARLILHGRALVDELERRARKAGCFRLRLWCAIDLAANMFWSALSFQNIGWRWGRGKKSRRHLLWVRPLNHSSESPATPVPPPPSARDHTNCWRALPELLPAD